MKFNKDKFKDALAYIISKLESNVSVGKTVLCKILYFSDFNYYELFEKSITNESYQKYEHGPFPIHFEEIINELIKEGTLSIKEEPYFNRNICRYKLNKKIEISHLTTKEINFINQLISDFKAKNLLSANAISAYSHGDMPWKIAKDNEILDYESVFYRDPEYALRTYDDCEDYNGFLEEMQVIIDNVSTGDLKDFEEF